MGIWGAGYGYCIRGYWLWGTGYGVPGGPRTELALGWGCSEVGLGWAATGTWKHGMGMNWDRAGTGMGVNWDRADTGRGQRQGTGGTGRGQCGCEGLSPTPSAAP